VLAKSGEGKTQRANRQEPFTRPHSNEAIQANQEGKSQPFAFSIKLMRRTPTARRPYPWGSFASAYAHWRERQGRRAAPTAVETSHHLAIMLSYLVSIARCTGRTSNF